LHQSRKDFLPLLFWSFDLGLRPDTYAAEAKKGHLSASVFKRGISHDYCIGSNGNLPLWPSTPSSPHERRHNSANDREARPQADRERRSTFESPLA